MLSITDSVANLQRERNDLESQVKELQTQLQNSMVSARPFSGCPQHTILYPPQTMFEKGYLGVSLFAVGMSAYSYVYKFVWQTAC